MIKFLQKIFHKEKENKITIAKENKITIAVDLNDVLRDYTRNFAQYYKRTFDPDLELEQVEVKSHKMDEVFKFESKGEYERFVYEDYPWELFAKCPACERGLGAEFVNWVDKTIRNIDVDAEVNVILVSTFEYGLTIPSTYWFISRIGARVREVYLPKNSATIWDRCSVLVTANPQLIKNKPAGKTVIKIETDYNTNAKADYSYISMSKFLEDGDTIEHILKEK